MTHSISPLSLSHTASIPPLSLSHTADHNFRQQDAGNRDVGDCGLGSSSPTGDSRTPPRRSLHLSDYHSLWVCLSHSRRRRRIFLAKFWQKDVGEPSCDLCRRAFLSHSISLSFVEPVCELCYVYTNLNLACGLWNSCNFVMWKSFQSHFMICIM